MIDTGAGVIDGDYRGVVFILLFNFSDEDFESKTRSLDTPKTPTLTRFFSPGRRPYSATYP